MLTIKSIPQPFGQYRGVVLRNGVVVCASVFKTSNRNHAALDAAVIANRIRYGTPPGEAAAMKARAAAEELGFGEACPN